MKLIVLAAVLTLVTGQAKVPLNTDCNLSWNKYVNSHANGLEEQAGITSEADCQTACEKKDTCWSFDFDFSDNSCWQGSVYKPARAPADSANHWDLIRDCSTPTGTDCASIHRSSPNAKSGIYSITIPGRNTSAQVYCDMVTSGGGWTVFQRRKDGSQDFYRLWADYVNGFGKLDGEFWIGNDLLASLTASQQYRLRVDLGDWDGAYRYAEYSAFSVADASDKYRLKTLGAFSGDAGDSLTLSKNQRFSTYDNDNDIWGANCASTYRGAWWYAACHLANLNGQYNDTTFGEGINWQTWRGHFYSLKFTEMKLRPVIY